MSFTHLVHGPGRARLGLGPITKGPKQLGLEPQHKHTLLGACFGGALLVVGPLGVVGGGVVVVHSGPRVGQSQNRLSAPNLQTNLLKVGPLLKVGVKPHFTSWPTKLAIFGNFRYGRVKVKKLQL